MLHGADRIAARVPARIAAQLRVRTYSDHACLANPARNASVSASKTARPEPTVATGPRLCVGGAARRTAGLAPIVAPVLARADAVEIPVTSDAAA
jgi:hypothetical protein